MNPIIEVTNYSREHFLIVFYMTKVNNRKCMVFANLGCDNSETNLNDVEKKKEERRIKRKIY